MTHKLPQLRQGFLDAKRNNALQYYPQIPELGTVSYLTSREWLSEQLFTVNRNLSRVGNIHKKRSFSSDIRPCTSSYERHWADPQRTQPNSHRKHFIMKSLVTKVFEIAHYSSAQHGIVAMLKYRLVRHGLSAWFLLSAPIASRPQNCIRCKEAIFMLKVGLIRLGTCGFFLILGIPVVSGTAY